MNNLDSVLLSFLSDSDRKELLDNIIAQVIKEAQDTLAKLPKDKLIQAYGYIKQLSFINDLNHNTVTKTLGVEDKSDDNKLYIQDNTHVDENSGIYRNNYSTENDEHGEHDVSGFDTDVRYAPFPGIVNEHVIRIRGPPPPMPGKVYGEPPALF